MPITKKEAKSRTESQGLSSTGIEHVASLARLGLSEKEKEKLSRELSGILDYFEKLKKIDTEGIEPTTQVTGLTNVFREDGRSHELDVVRIKKMIGQAPEREENFVKTKTILEK